MPEVCGHSALDRFRRAEIQWPGRRTNGTKSYDPGLRFDAAVILTALAPEGRQEAMFQFAETPNLRHLRMVQVIGRMGGVSSASRELCASQPTVTQAVANLEAEIGTPIFERCATGTYPTPLGRRYLLRIDRFFEILDGAVAHVLGRQEGGTGRAATHVDRLMTGTQLRSFIVASELGRVEEIARSLELSPASLLRSARSLEGALGKPLFDRTAKGPIPNKTGEMLGREFRRAIREIELARGEILLEAGAEDLELVVGALPMAGSQELAEATRRFMALHPSVKVRLVSSEYHALLADLHNSRIDMIFGMLRRAGTPAGVREDLLFRDSYCLVARPGHPLAKLAEVAPPDLLDCQWVVPSPGTPRRNRIEAIFEGMAAQPRFNLETSSLGMGRALLMGSDAVTLMTRSEVRNDLEQGMLVALRCSSLDDVLLKGVTTRHDWLPTQAHTAFIECLRASTTEATEHVSAKGRRESMSHA
ncbi:LysR family transcriptional regulator [Scleromatobacter humisilvae]|uniref:LysR substrate-binding domain-containing protein n=1 Tax=Scleromatobacter humisilvae TaxID=2897159 RepID=A0A9X1YGJ9_9BURK|nr:LysR substrate-binding domain-containing protein [Scleromatobacter humisilvae]MCK9685332.1 LysR substrate-binding domain-containing protein [Scleromatobacter humisilvae]